MEFRIDINKTELASFIRFVNGMEDTIEKGLHKAMLYAEAQAKLGFGKKNRPKVRTGRLRSSIASGAKGLEGWIGTNVVYGPTHEFGAIIRPKVGEWLRFQINGQWKTVKQVTIPKRPFLAPAITDNADKIVDIITQSVREAFYHE